MTPGRDITFRCPDLEFRSLIHGVLLIGYHMLFIMGLG